LIPQAYAGAAPRNHLNLSGPKTLTHDTAPN
jgi:hypothetical protein